MFDIKAIRVKQNKIKQPKASDAGILPEHPFRMYIIGASGSGKTNFMLNLMDNKHMYKNYFDSVLVISPTARELDASYQVLRLDDQNYFPPDPQVLHAIQEIQEKHISEKGKHKSPKVLVIIDDIVSYKTFLNSPIFLRFAVMSRHWNISLILMSQAYHRIPKSVRLQMSCIVYFKGSNKECDVLADDFGAPGLSKKEFIKRIDYATSDRYNFFFVDVHRAMGSGRYRKNLTEEIIP